MKSDRTIKRILVLTLFGNEKQEFVSAQDAIEFIKNVKERDEGYFVRLEMQLLYKADIEMNVAFGDKDDAIEFLQNREKGLL